jgi:hypothetical protein
LPARTARAWCWTCSQAFVEPLEDEFGVKSNHRIGRFSDASQSAEYHDRIEAINFSLAHDDGQSSRNLDIADVILVGVSRSGKTPTSLYLAMQHGIKAANYPLIPDDFERGKLPSSLAPHKRKCFGLTIDPTGWRRSATSAARPAGTRRWRTAATRSTRPSDDASRRHRLAVVDAQVDRRDRHHHPARPAARPPDLLAERPCARGLTLAQRLVQTDGRSSGNVQGFLATRLRDAHRQAAGVQQAR